jgi:hypothetical protein
LRKGEGPAPLLGAAHRKLAKKDLPGLTRDEMYAFVVKTYSQAIG